MLCANVSVPVLDTVRLPLAICRPPPTRLQVVESVHTSPLIMRHDPDSGHEQLSAAASVILKFLSLALNCQLIPSLILTST